MQVTAQQAKAENWRRGRLHWKLKPIQKRLKSAFESCKDFIFVCLVARQTGKTFHWVTVAIELCLKKPNARVRFGTAFQSDLEEFIKPLFERIIEDAPKDVKPKWKSQGSKYTFPSTGAECKLVGLDINPDGIRGNALDLVIIEEAGFVGKLRYVILIIIAMLRHRPELRVVLTSSRPETPDHEFNTYVEEARVKGNLFEATIDDDETCTIETKTRIATEYGGFESAGYRRECLNELIIDPELAIIPEWDDKYVGVYDIESDPYWKYYHRYTAQDIGGTKEFGDFTAHIYATYIFSKDLLYVQAESGIRGSETKTDSIAEMVKRNESKLWADDGEWNRKLAYKRISDNNNPILLNDLAKGIGRDGKEHGISFIATNKDELGAMINQLRLRVQRGGLLVDPVCRLMIGCLKGGIFNSSRVKKELSGKKREFARSKVYGHYDWLAGLIYLERNLDISTNPIPKNIGANVFTHHIRPGGENISQTAKALGSVMGKKFVAGVKH